MRKARKDTEVANFILFYPLMNYVRIKLSDRPNNKMNSYRRGTRSPEGAEIMRHIGPRPCHAVSNGISAFVSETQLLEISARALIEGSTIISVKSLIIYRFPK